MKTFFLLPFSVLLFRITFASGLNTNGTPSPNNSGGGSGGGGGSSTLHHLHSAHPTGNGNTSRSSTQQPHYHPHPTQSSASASASMAQTPSAIEHFDSEDHDALMDEFMDAQKEFEQTALECDEKLKKLVGDTETAIKEHEHDAARKLLEELKGYKVGQVVCDKGAAADPTSATSTTTATPSTTGEKEKNSKTEKTNVLEKSEESNSEKPEKNGNGVERLMSSTWIIGLMVVISGRS